MNEINRRRVLAGLATTILPPLFGCAHKIEPICPTSPEISDISSPLTIDAHAHIFNGRDLQIKEFISQVVVGHQDSELYQVAVVLGGLLQSLGWHAAPDERDELQALSEYQAGLQNCAGEDALQKVASRAFEKGYAIGVAQLREAKRSLERAPEGATVLGPAPGFGDALGAVIDDLPPTFREYEKRRSDAAIVLGGRPTVHGYINFVLHHFNYRHVNALDYLRTYSPRSPRKIDLLVASMVDYDYWLAKGASTPTTLEAQVDLMVRVCEVTQGRVHGFAPYCPFREVMTSSGGSPGAALRLVQRAVMSEGFLGVKMYPPMGFAPWGNTGLKVWAGKPTLLPAAADPEFGKRLDEALQRLFDWCIANEVPVMAHTNRSNAPYDDFKDLAGAEYWQLALQKFPGLDVNFGHFGDTDLEDDDGKGSRTFIGLMSDEPNSGGLRAFADSAYFAGVLTQPKAVEKVLMSLYADSRKQILADRLMYGTDWTMTLPQQNVDKYLAQFIEVMRTVQEQGLVPASSGNNLSDAFFGRNAVRYLGLASGRANRKRLEDFYDHRKIAQPDWMKKVI